ncbi:arylsulfatase [Prosthecobacter sp.]|uniref:arylsulfatase n=1 Tax=Prosthecobacter sp. TaxID=1965333 RepID=UPI001D5FE760|nr:arylsulfatase [Prosthecobacter sp.]MCB1279564.1 arylsulfatase [Prosthecobacter sp.]
MRRLLILLSSFIGLASSFAAEQPPNFLLVMVDDMGFSDLGCYGSEIDTPNMDKLAANGVRFTQFYNTAKCHSSRVSLLSGRWCRQAGDESLKRAVVIPEVLAPAGYFTAMTGKWHLSKEPTDFGFQRYFGHLSGACNYYLGDKTFRLNGEKWTVPEQGFYTTIANVDRAIEFIGEARAAKKPWFQYVAFNAPHAPLQPLEADYKKYLGRYDVGWDTIRVARVAKQKQIGLLPTSLQESPRPDHVRAWDKLDDAHRAWEAKRMAAYAGMIDRVDREMGRLIGDLETHGELDNTVILFVSDNGACPYDRGAPQPDAQPFDPNTHWSDSTGWAWARNSPFRYYKQNQFEGGISSPAILHWPAGLKQKPGSVIDQPAHLVDVLPTFAELAGAKVPATFPDRELTPLVGISLAPLIAGGEIKARPPIHLLFSSDRGLRDGDWKIVSYKSQPWELYHISTDRTELRDVAAQHPDIVERMVRQWHDMSEHVLMTKGKELAPVATEATPQTNREWTDYDKPLMGSEAKRKKGKGKAKSAAAELPRARKGTKLTVEGDQLVLTCTGDDPGLAFDKLVIEQPGPYTLEFKLQSKSSGSGELYWTTDTETTLPQGKHLGFDVKHDGEWHQHAIRIDELKTMHALRLDPCGGEGEARIGGLVLKAADGKELAKWP